MSPYYIYDDFPFQYDPVEFSNLADAAKIYVDRLTLYWKCVLNNKKRDLKTWDSYYFDRSEWEIDCDKRPYSLYVWTGEKERNDISHVGILNSLPKDAEVMKEYDQVLDEINKYNTKELNDMVKLVEKREHPGRAITLKREANLMAYNSKRAAEIMAEPRKSSRSSLEARVAALEAKLSDLASL